MQRSWIYAGSVRDSAELKRIRALPRRTEPPRGCDRLSDVLTLDGAQTLRPVQAQSLGELHEQRGLLGLVRVGGGKTLVTYLAPVMVDAKRPLLIVPAKLVKKTERDFAELAQHWQGGGLVVKSYEWLSHMNHATFLDSYKPDMIVADECHKLKNVRAACTRRVGRYMSAHPETIFVGLSGTLTKRSLMDFAHMAQWALGDGAPVPLTYKDLVEWCGALDESPIDLYEVGALKQFDEGDGVRVGVQRRIRETPGVVSTTETPIDASLVIHDWWSDYEQPREISDALEVLYEQWQTPSGIELVSAADVWRTARELALGFYYVWKETPPKKWLAARKRWAAFAREVLLRSRTLDTPAQVAQRFADDERVEAWQVIRDSYTPVVVPVWITREVVERAAQWARDRAGIVWTDLVAVGVALRGQGVPYYGEMGLDGSGKPIENATGGIAASVAANKEGRNLQHYSRNLILTPPTTGSDWEQLLGRTHRDGQMADEVSAEVFLGCAENAKAFTQAKADATYQQQLTGNPQKLLEATVTF